ncbi:tol-pal system-associated acyl-CoA thioesterase [Gammaproteobacteria bacterium]|jgi:acyl-CoA thioester hydrolase|nr:tol-pal system-associated acyl-CoA thioesterase [Gammaproteobacteria bacterium]|tara:strand:+ start:1631 stop:2029 length:399 start_codon:yes stop_codon:yes gene_type:complete
MKIRVYYEDTDAGGIVYYANYFKFTERGRTELLRDLGVSQSEILKKYDIKFIVHSVSMKYINPAFLDDQLTVETKINNLKKASVDFNQNIYKVLNNKKIDIVKSKCRIVCINSNQKINAIPDLILKKFSEEV